jgi:hypothetical protein
VWAVPVNNVAQKEGNVKALTNKTKIENFAIIYNRMRPILIVLCVLASGALFASDASAQASNVYITPDGGGSGVCTNNTHPPSWFNNSGNWGNGSSQIGPGTVVHVCGSFNDSTPNDTLLSFQASGTPGHPVTLLFESGTTLTNSNYWNDYSGAILSDGKSNITVDGGTNGLIQNTGNGSAFPNKHDTKGLVIRNCSNCVVKNLHVDNLYVHIPGTSASSPGEDGPSPNGIATGIECAGCSNSVLGPNNEAHDDFAGISYNWEHTSGRNMEIYGNTVSRNNWGILAAGQSGGIDGLKIHNNDVSDAFPWDDWFNGNHHNGIMVFEVGPASTISNLQQYNNYIHGNMGNICVDGLSHTTAFIFNDYNGGTWVAPILFNNVLVNTNPNCGPGNGMLTVVSTSGSGGIYNNTFTGRGTAINLTGNPFIIKNNIFTKIDLGISNQKGVIGASDYNLFYGLTGADHAPGAVMVDHNSSINFYSNIAQWMTSSGFDSHAATANPNLTGNFQLGSGTGAAGGTNLSSLGIPALNVDRAGSPRPTSGSWNQGAYQAGSTSGSAPTPPTNLSVVVH